MEDNKTIYASPEELIVTSEEKKIITFGKFYFCTCCVTCMQCTMASCGHLTPRPHACSALSHGSYCLHCNLPPARPGERRHARLHDTASVRVLTAREDE